MEENTCEAILPHINGNVVRKDEKMKYRGAKAPCIKQDFRCFFVACKHNVA